MPPDGWGSGKPGRPWVRMHCAKARSAWKVTGPAGAAPPEDEGLPPHAVSTAAAATTARAPARRGPRLPPVLLFIAASSGTALPANHLYRTGGDSKGTENVTWLSPAACD